MKNLATALLLGFLYAAAVQAAVYPDNIVRRGLFYPPFFSELLDVQLAEDYAYVSGVGGLLIFDIRNPDEPFLVGRLNTYSIYKRFYTSSIVGNLAFSCARQDGLYIIRHTDKTAPELLLQYNPEGVSFEAVAVRGDLIFAAVHQRGIWCLRMREFGQVDKLHEAAGFTNAWDVEFLNDSLAAVADGEAGLKIVRLSSSAAEILASMPLSGSAREVVLQGAMAYVAVGSEGMDIVDLSDPLRPVLVGNFQAGGITNHLRVQGTLAYLATWRHIQVVDLTDPTAPVLLATEEAPIRAMGLAARDSLIYVADWAAFEIYDYVGGRAPDIEVEAPPLLFARSRRSYPVQIRNLGQEPLHIERVGFTSQDFALEGEPPDDLEPGQTAEITVRYAAQLFTPQFAKLQIESDDPDEKLIELSMFVSNYRFGVGDTAVPFTLEDTQGETHRLEDYRGRIVVLVFFASW